MSKVLVATLQVIAGEIDRLEARRQACLREANELKTAIKNLQKISICEPKKGEKMNQKIAQKSKQDEVINEPKID